MQDIYCDNTEDGALVDTMKGRLQSRFAGYLLRLIFESTYAYLEEACYNPAMQDIYCDLQGRVATIKAFFLLQSRFAGYLLRPQMY